VSNAMELSQDTLKQIGEYVKQHLPEWTRETGSPGVEASTAEELRREIDIRGRIVRVEEELKTSRELMREGFAAVNRRFEDQTAHFNTRFEAIDKRFEDQAASFNARFETIDKRFEDMNSRFTDMQKHTNRWMTLISVFLAVIGAMPWIMGAY
jgi:chromosome segregation ATPase